MPTKLKLPRAIRLFSQYGVQALVPKIESGRYFGPMISKRVAAKFIKKAKIESLYGNPTEIDNAWLKYDESRVKNMWGLKPLKGHKRDRTLVDRVNRVNKAMETMPQKIEKYYEDAADRRPKKDIHYLFKRVEEIARNKFRNSKSEAVEAGKNEKSGK